MDGKAGEGSGELLAYAAFQYLLGEAELLRIAVAPRARRGGLGQRLLEGALEHLMSEGLEICYLEVRADNRAATHLYECLGFEVSGRRQRYYQDGCDALLFSWAPRSSSSKDARTTSAMP